MYTHTCVDARTENQYWIMKMHVFKYVNEIYTFTATLLLFNLNK